MTADDWFAAGEDFWTAAVVLEVQQAPTNPNVVCRAFAAEAYLKCLLTLREKRFPGDHNLRNLFKLLPLADKQVIEELWNERSLPNLLKAKAAAPSQFSIAGTMQQALKQCGDAFKNWRYKPWGKNYWVIGSFPREVRRVILTVRPEWEESPPGKPKAKL